jgi:F0F1-type ATP synthase delta subunit
MPLNWSARELTRQCRNPQSERLAAVYAKALLGSAEGTSHIDEVMEDVDAFVAEMLDSTCFPNLNSNCRP